MLLRSHAISSTLRVSTGFAQEGCFTPRDGIWRHSSKFSGKAPTHERTTMRLRVIHRHAPEWYEEIQ